MFKAHRLVYHSTLGLRVIKKRKKCPSPAPHGKLLTNTCATTPALRADANRLFQALDLYRRSLECGDLLHTSRQLKRTI